MTTAFLDAFLVEPDNEPVVVVGVHQKDQHVSGLAIATGSDTIVTHNLRHFPARPLTKHGLRAISPGALVAELDRDDPQQIDRAVESLARRWKNPPRMVDEILDLLVIHPSMAIPMRAVRARNRTS